MNALAFTNNLKQGMNMNKKITESVPLKTGLSITSFLNQINEKKEDLIKQGFSIQDIKVANVEIYDNDADSEDSDYPSGFELELQAERDETPLELAVRQAEVVAKFENQITTLPKIIQEANTHLSKLVSQRKEPLDPAKHLLESLEISISKQVNLVNALNQKYKKFKSLVGKIRFEDVDRLEKQFTGTYDIS